MIARKLLSIAIVALFAAPAAAATWKSFGTYEPSTSYDIEQTWMWPDVPDGQGDQVYFNAYVTSHSANVGVFAINPNVGAAGSNFHGSGTSRWFAIFGIWRDCNGDGYVGMAETAALEYRAELLTNTATCPVDTNTPSPSCPASCVATKRPTHNDGKWINEFLMIGDQRNVLTDGTQTPNDPATDRRIFNDHGARVWGDTGLPGDPVPGTRCPLNPQPRGTYASTGGMIQYADCSLALGDEWNTVVDTADSSNMLGLRLTDQRNWNQAGHPLNQGTFGSEHSDYSAVKAFDCTKVAFQTTQAGNTITIYQPDPAVRRTDGTAPATANETFESAPVRTGTKTNNCDPTDKREGDFYGAVEDDWERVENANKKEVGIQMFFSAMARGGAPAVVLDPSNAHRQDPQDLGLVALHHFFGSYWASESVGTGTTTPVPARHGLAAPDDLEPNPEVGANPLYWTWYAYTTFKNSEGWRTPGGNGVYGQEWCLGATTGIVNGFNCNGHEWVKNADGSSPADREVRTKAGDPYFLRDIDCIDSNPTTLVETGLRTCA